jgi:hypothetical protein
VALARNKARSYQVCRGGSDGNYDNAAFILELISCRWGWRNDSELMDSWARGETTMRLRGRTNECLGKGNGCTGWCWVDRIRMFSLDGEILWVVFRGV